MYKVLHYAKLYNQINYLSLYNQTNWENFEAFNVTLVFKVTLFHGTFCFLIVTVAAL